MYASDIVFDVGNIKHAIDDANASALGVPVGGIYRNGNSLSIRLI